MLPGEPDKDGYVPVRTIEEDNEGILKGAKEQLLAGEEIY